MFHVFNKIYLENVLYYTSTFPSKVIGSQSMPHPLARYNLELGEMMGALPSFEEYIKTSAGGSVDSIWKEFYEEKTDKAFVIYVDTPLELKLKVIYWKTFFKKPDPDILFWLHNSSILERRLKSSDFLQTNELKRETISQSLNFVTREDFDKIYSENTASEYLSSINRECISFEYLLANHFFSPNSQYEAIFKEKLKKIAWKAWYNDISILREDIFNSIFDIKKLFPELEINTMEPEKFEEALYASPETNWLFDADFNRETAEQALSKYPKEIFLKAQQRALELIAKDGDYFETFQKALMSPIDNPVHRTELLFSENYYGFLQDCIAQRFGSIFSTSALPGKISSCLISYIFETVKSGHITKLSCFELN
jgi:hypothetical protein